MAPPQNALDKAKSMLEGATRPIFFHDDDCDGTTSFVICYQFCAANKGEGKSIPVKRSPSVTHEFLKKAEEINADLIVILDKPKAEREFLQGARVPVLWIDHHEPQKETIAGLGNVFYFNPRLWDDRDNRPTSYWAYQITKTNLWLATVGSVGDWFLPEYIAEFREKYPDLAPKEYKRVEDAYIDSPIGTLVRVIQFNLKGMTAEAKKSIITLTRIESPYEILSQTTSRGRFLWRKYERLAAGYDKVLAEACATAAQPGKVLLYLYTDDSMTFTSELSNELLIRYPDRIIFIGRRHDGAVKASIRSTALAIPLLLTEALKGLEGYGGGHRNACGMNVAEKDWDEFFRRFTDLVEKA
jgi:single-stranded DNA-specific DHH superfamily exonuclease